MFDIQGVLDMTILYGGDLSAVPTFFTGNLKLTNIDITQPLYITTNLPALLCIILLKKTKCFIQLTMELES